MRVQIPVGDSYSTDCQNIVVTDVQPLTGLWGPPHRQRLQTGNPLTGCGRERPRATDMEALTGLGGIRKRAHHRPAEIDEDIRKAEDVLCHDLTFRRLLRP